MPISYIEKSSMELVPNPNWSGDPVKVAKIVLRYIDDTSVAMNAYRTGEIDATVLPPAEYTATKADAELSKELQQYAAPKTYGLTFNQRPGQLGASKDLRLAFSQAIDRTKMNQVVFLGSQIPTTSWMPPGRSGTPAGTFDSVLGFDQAKAKASLVAAGYPEGKGFPKLALTLVDTPSNKDLGAFLKDSWKKVLGVDVDLEFVDGKTMSSRFVSGDFQIALPSWQEDYPDPEAWFIGIRESAGSVNLAKCGMPELDDLITKAKFNLNDEQRRAQYRDAESLSLNNAQCSVPLWHASSLRMVKPYISGMIEGRRGSDRFVVGDWYPEKWSTNKK
jgi:oligopeptide transport system substrate-binding protein